MLAKLLKTEFSATARVHLILIAASLGLTLFTSLSMLAVGAFSDNMATLMLVTGPAYLLSSIIMPVTLSFPILHAAWRFYKNLAGDEGYLMHMLPVPTGFLVLSKAIVACLWTLASSVIGLVGYFVTNILYTLTLTSTVPNVDVSIGDMLRELSDLFGAGFAITPDIVFIVVNVILILIFSFIFSIVSVYLCIAIGQMWTAHRILGSIIAYFALSFILNIVVSIGLILLIVVGFGSLTAFNILLVLLTLLTAGSCVVCYLLTVRIFRNRLNLQ